MASPAASRASSDAADRRRIVAARLAQLGQPRVARRTPPPEGRLGADEFSLKHLCVALGDLGPVFAGFGRYLSSRPDLLRRRETIELAAIPDSETPMSPARVEATVAQALGRPIERGFFDFDREACGTSLWTERHRAWLAPGVPVLVTLVRPDAPAWLASDVPLLPMLQPWLDLSPLAMAEAADDFAETVRRRLNQTLAVTALATISADHSAHGGFDAPVCYRDHCAPGILTIEQPVGPTLADIFADAPPAGVVWESGELHGPRLVSAWLTQALLGRVVPFEFEPSDVIVAAGRLVLIGGAFEVHAADERARFLRYINAVASDDPDAAAAWIVEVAGPARPGRNEDTLRRRFRQAVPFRDGEWSGDERLAEYMLVQWRMARDTGWPLTPHHLHLYRGLQAATGMAGRLAPHDDTLLAALQQRRVQAGLAEARRLLDPGALESTLDRLMLGLVHLPQKLDAVLTLAAEGRLHVKLNVPDGEDASRTRNRTILLIALLVALTGLASVARQFAPAFGPGAERLAAVTLLVLGGWLLVVAARM